MLIKDVMTPLPFTVRPSMSVLEARAEMDRRRFRHLLVVDEAGLLVGIATDRDIRLNLPSPATSLSVWEINYLVGRLTVGVSHGKVSVEHCQDCGEAVEGRTGKIDRFERAITVEGGVDAALAAKLVEIAGKCPVHRTLGAGAAVVTNVSDPRETTR